MSRIRSLRGLKHHPLIGGVLYFLQKRYVMNWENKTPEKKKDVRERDLKSKMILYNHSGGIYVELNETARYVWKIVDKKPLNEVIVEYARYYEVDLKTAKTDVFDVLRELELKGMITSNRLEEVKE
jgi:two-component SAPR family response regulator